jgi:cytochrome P450
MGSPIARQSAPMNYLQLLAVIRSITGSRSHDRFPAIQPLVSVVRRDDGGAATFVVGDAEQAKLVLQSPCYRQFNFVERILTIAKPERTPWIRRFCEIGLIMTDGPEHQRRRLLMQQSLDRCASGVRAIPQATIAAVIEDAMAVEPCTSAGVACQLVLLLFSKSISALSGQTSELPARDLFAVDFFNPFPTLSSLARCNEAIANCCRAIGIESLDEADEAAVLSLLAMGVSPLHALLTSLINVYAAALCDGAAAGEAVKRTAALDSYAVVPTNFVMRRCVAPDTISGERVDPGDIIYLFLGAATGCPFSRHTSVPFGAGQHYCSGAVLTQVMLNAVRTALKDVRSDCRRLSPSTEVQGKAAAFLTFASGT